MDSGQTAPNEGGNRMQSVTINGRTVTRAQGLKMTQGEVCRWLNGAWNNEWAAFYRLLGGGSLKKGYRLANELPR